MVNTLLALAGFVVVVVTVLVLTARSGRQWQRKLDDILLPIGFIRCSTDAAKAALAQRLGIVNPRHQGKRLLLHLYQRTPPGGGYTLQVCDYHFASAGGRASGGGWVLVALVAPALSLPRLSITGVGTGPAMLVRLASVLDTQIEVPGMRHVQTGDDGLDRRFLVHAAEGGPGPAALHALLGVLARSGSDPSLDTGGDTLVLSSVAMMADRTRQELDSQKLQAQIHLAQQLFEALRKDSATAVLHIAAAQP